MNTLDQRSDLLNEKLDMCLYNLSGELETLVDEQHGKGAFRRLYARWYKKQVNALFIDAWEKIPEMVRELRTTGDPFQIAMLVTFLASDYGLHRMTVRYVLDELQLNEEEDK